MNIEQTITTLEIAEMMGVPHADILKKMEGRKDRKGYFKPKNINYKKRSRLLYSYRLLKKGSDSEPF